VILKLNRVMIKISNFSSVLEIAFGLNALFFLFELVPRTEERVRGLVEKYEQVYQQKVKATGSTEAFPVGFVISATYPYKKRLMEKITVIMSLVLLGFLIYSSFVPDAEMSSRRMWVLLFFSFGTPFVAISICKGPIRRLEAAIKVLEHQTNDARQSKSKKEVDEWRNQRQSPPATNPPPANIQ